MKRRNFLKCSTLAAPAIAFPGYHAAQAAAVHESSATHDANTLNSTVIVRSLAKQKEHRLPPPQWPGQI